MFAFLFMSVILVRTSLQARCIFDYYLEVSSILLGAYTERSVCLGMTVGFMPQALI